ncbi:MAG: class I SAM-dependent methyltransferase [Pseudomonadota bacterium]
MIEFVDPNSGRPLRSADGSLAGADGAVFPIVAGVPRFCAADNYASNFGKQWNIFDTTQIDGVGVKDNISERRFFAETGWSPERLAGLDILEVGSGAGRFSRVVLERTTANLYSVDYSSAVDANWNLNGGIAPERFRLAQASVYELPFPDDAFDRVFCLGVLQHTPDFEASVKALVAKAKVGGEIVVDFYPIRGWWTKIHAKYLLRPLTKRVDHDRLLGLVERNVDWMIKLSDRMTRAGLGPLTRFLPLVDQKTLPDNMSAAERREWSVLDTFDQYSPEHDHPQRIADVAAMFERAGAQVSHAGFVDFGAAVVRAVRRPD